MQIKFISLEYMEKFKEQDQSYNWLHHWTIYCICDAHTFSIEYTNEKLINKTFCKHKRNVEIYRFIARLSQRVRLGFQFISAIES